MMIADARRQLLFNEHNETITYTSSGGTPVEIQAICNLTSIGSVQDNDGIRATQLAEVTVSTADVGKCSTSDVYEIRGEKFKFSATLEDRGIGVKTLQLHAFKLLTKGTSQTEINRQ